MPPAPAQAISTAAILAITLGLGLCFTAMVMWGMSYLTGWRRLAAQFPARAPLPGAESSFGSIGFYALGNYNNCVRFRMDDDCLHVRLILPFNFGHPPMSIPWPAVELLDKKPTWGMHHIRIAGVPARVPKRVIAREHELRRQLQSIDPPGFDPGAEGGSQMAARSS
jgi:hypothetical protein